MLCIAVNKLKMFSGWSANMIESTKTTGVALHYQVEHHVRDKKIYIF